MWGDGEPEGVRRRAAEAMQVTARAAAALGVDTVIGFTGSKIWKTVAMFPPVPQSMVDDGYQDFADRWNPILDVFDEVGVRFAHEVHPSEIAYDYWTATAALEAIGRRPAFGLNWDPSHFVWQDLDPVGFLWDFRDRIYHVDCKDAKRQTGNGRNGRMGSHLAWADPRRGWDFVSTGHGDVPWEACFRMLNTIGYQGPISIEWEDAGMDRLVGAPEALEFVRRLAFDPPSRGLRRGVQQRRLSRDRRRSTSATWCLPDARRTSTRSRSCVGRWTRPSAHSAAGGDRRADGCRGSSRSSRSCMVTRPSSSAPSRTRANWVRSRRMVASAA